MSETTKPDAVALKMAVDDCFQRVPNALLLGLANRIDDLAKALKLIAEIGDEHGGAIGELIARLSRQALEEAGQ